jgi:hypothetical protein
MTSKWGIISVRTGQIFYTNADIYEQRHFSLPFNIYWGEMRANGNLGYFYFNYNSGNQTFDGFPLTISAASLSLFIQQPLLRNNQTLAGALIVAGDLSFPFWGSRNLTILDYNNISSQSYPFNSHYALLTPSKFELIRKWGSGRSEMIFNNLSYDETNQDGFHGDGNVNMLTELTGTLASSIDIKSFNKSVITNIGFCSNKYEVGGGFSVTDEVLNGTAAGIKLGPVGGIITINGDQLQKIIIESGIEFGGETGNVVTGTESLYLNGNITTEVTPSSITIGSMCGLSVSYAPPLVPTVGFVGTSIIKLKLSGAGLFGDFKTTFNTLGSDILGVSGSGQLSLSITLPATITLPPTIKFPSAFIQGDAKLKMSQLIPFPSQSSFEGAFVAAFNAPISELWALDRIGKKLTAKKLIEDKIGSDKSNISGFYAGIKAEESAGISGVLEGKLSLWGGAGMLVEQYRNGIIKLEVLANAGIEISGDFISGLASAKCSAELAGEAGIKFDPSSKPIILPIFPVFDICGAASFTACGFWICDTWSEKKCLSDIDF